MEEKTSQTETPEIVHTQNITPQMHIDRFGKIFFNMFITAFVLAFSSVFLALFLPVLYTFVMMMIFVLGLLLCGVLIVGSMGTIFITENNILPNIWNFIMSITNKSDSIAILSNIIYKSLPYFTIAGLVLSIVSTIMIFVNKQNKSIGKIILIIVFAVALIVLLILYYLLGGTLWQM